MQRPIKFRQIKDGRVHYWGYIENMGFVTPMASAEWHDIPSDQYTGLHDRHGKEIYEGDIVKSGHNTFKIVWVQTMCCFKKRSIDGSYDSDLWLSKSDTLEVIGNVYQTPELLERTA